MVGREHLIQSLQKLANGVLEELGATATEIEQLPKLEDVTTSSIEALQAFSLACSSSDPGEIIGLLRHSLTLDRKFASAQVWLASLLWFQGTPKSEVVEMMEDALLQADRLTDTERLSCQTLLAFVRGDLDQALNHTQVLADLHPEKLGHQTHLIWSHWSLFNDFASGLEIARALPRCSHCDVSEEGILRFKGFMELAAGDHRLAAAYFGEALEGKDPLDRALFLTLVRDLDGATVALEEATGEHSRTRSWKLAKGWIFLLLEQGKIEEALRLHDQRSAAVGSASPGQSTLKDLEWQLLKLGPQSYSGTSALDETLEMVQGATASLIDRAPHSTLLFAVAVTGKIAARSQHLDRAEDAARRLEELVRMDTVNTPRRAYEHLLLGEIARARGEHDLAVRELTRSLQEMETFTVHESLASFYESVGNVEKAIEHTQWLVSNRGRAVLECPLSWECYEKGYNRVAWGLAHVRLARLLESRGETAEAMVWYSEIARLWPHGDAQLAELQFARQRLEKLTSLD